MNKKVKWFIILCLICLLAMSDFFIDKYRQMKDLKEVESIVANYDLKYKSERAFGNDRFDIYSFTLKENNDLDEFVLKDDVLLEVYSSNFDNLLSKYSQNDEYLNSLRLDINDMIQKDDTLYRIINFKGTDKLYLYSKSIDIGYCLILTI